MLLNFWLQFFSWEENQPKIANPLGKMWRLLFISLCVYQVHADATSDIVVHTDKGKIRGMHTIQNLPHIQKSVVKFLGVPFAKPPLNHLRFRHPQPVDSWEGILNATQLPNSCYQIPDEMFGTFRGSAMWNPTTEMSEDCLYLNVWVPKTSPRLRKAAVLVWIHGGGFFSGTPTLPVYDGATLAALNDVIVVSISYRVGVLGFLSLDRPSAPGNAGLFDQVMALDWVQRNINYFGGDPRKVTLFGSGAGAASVSLHLLSPLSHNKFQKAIMQSGTANMPWVTLDRANAKFRATELAGYLRCESTDDASVAECLRKIPPQKILEKEWVSRGIIQYPFLPVVDGVFLDDGPIKLLEQGRFKKCPILLGSNLNEATTFLMYDLIEDLSLRTKSMDSAKFDKSLEQLFEYFPQYPEWIDGLAYDAIAFQYSNPVDPDNADENIAALDNAIGDYYFTCSVNEFQRYYAKAGQKVFAYHFTHRTSSNPWPEWVGVNHKEEISYVFGEPYNPQTNFTEEEKLLSKKIMQHWVQFAKTGNPSLANEWPSYTETGMEYLELKTNPEAKSALRTKECSFWQDYLPKLMKKVNSMKKAIQTSCKTPDTLLRSGF